MSAKDTKTLFIMQKKIIRSITNASFNAPTHEMFKELEILKLSEVIELDLLKLIYSAVNGVLPTSLSNLFQLNCQFHMYNTRHRLDPVTSLHKKSITNKSFLVRGPVLWTNYPFDLKEKYSLKSFSRNSKQYLLSKY